MIGIVKEAHKYLEVLKSTKTKSKLRLTQIFRYDYMPQGVEEYRDRAKLEIANNIMLQQVFGEASESLVRYHGGLVKIQTLPANHRYYCINYIDKPGTFIIELGVK